LTTAPKLDHVFLNTGAVRLYTVQAGPDDGPLAILLHGFPEFCLTWKEQITALADAGFRVVAPDQRGFNLSEKPEGIGSYGIDALTEDIVGLIRALGREQASVVGHDWGAVVAWCLGILHPNEVDKIVAMNGPHPLVMEQMLERSWAQRRRSWYILFFQLPWLPEFVARLANWRIMTRVLLSSSLEGAFTEEELQCYREAWSQPGSFKSMLNWYRALRTFPSSLSRASLSRKITVPTLLVWGMKDRFLGSEMAQPSIDFCERGRLVMLPEATHWVNHEAAEPLNEILIEFLSGESDGESKPAIKPLESGRGRP